LQYKEDKNSETTPQDEPLDPAAAHAQLEDQQRDITRQMASIVPWIMLAWGVAWGVGFTLLWAIDGAEPAFSIPWPIAATIFIVLNIVAIIVSGILGARTGRGIRSAPDAAFTGAVYGVTWTVGFAAIFALGAALVANGMPQQLSNIYYPTASAVFVGIMYLLAGAIWHTWAMVALGGWFVLVGIVAPFLGYPTNYLVFAIAGGGMFLIWSVASFIWVRRGGAIRMMSHA
jgi:hypothetical protein